MDRAVPGQTDVCVSLPLCKVCPSSTANRQDRNVYVHGPINDACVI